MRRDLFWLTALEVSVQGQSVSLLWGLWQVSISQEEHMAEQSCSHHGKWKGRRKRRVDSNIPFNITSSAPSILPSKPYLLYLQFSPPSYNAKLGAAPRLLGKFHIQTITMGRRYGWTFGQHSLCNAVILKWWAGDREATKETRNITSQ